MRNLRNTHHVVLEFDDDARLAATAWDGDDLICCVGPTEGNPVITLKRLPQEAHAPGQCISIASWDSPSPNPDLAVDRVLHMHSLADSGAICLVLEGGDIVLVRENPQPGEDLIEIVGSVDAGIAAAGWSPDEELLVIVTKADTILYMTRDFEGTANITLSEEDLKVSNHVSVGWGKAETQFKGRGAKAMRDPTVPEHVDEGKLSDFDDGRITISWRGDGQFVAINSVLRPNDKERRIIRVYSREGTLESVSEPVDGLEGALSWKPSGQTIAGIQRANQKANVVFFERNGLRHGEFSLRLGKDELETCHSSISLHWNTDSSVLAVTTPDRIQFWTMGNYHYYLKQEVILRASRQTPVLGNWHPEKALQFVGFSPSELHALRYTFQVASGSVTAPHDHGTVAVIDGRSMKLNPLRTANVPPPMAFDEFNLSANAIDVAINRSGTRIAVLHHDAISSLLYDYGCKPVRKAQLEKTVNLPSKLSQESLHMRQITFDEKDQVVIVASKANTPGSVIFHLSEDGERTGLVDKNVSLLFHSTQDDRVFCQDDQGKVLELLAPDSTQQISSLPSACAALRMWRGKDYEIIFGLSASGILHIQSPVQSTRIVGCTSIEATSTHLIFTTSQHMLKFVHLHSGELEIPADEPEKDERCRSIERGAKLVTIIPSAYSLVLQMPRGNLETIYPRALVLAGIRQSLSERDYKKAFLICRTHRVDMNILHDFAPETFAKDVDLFVKQVKKVEFIDLFLSSLSEEDVSQTIYKDTVTGTGHASNLEGSVQDGGLNDEKHKKLSSKVNKVCDLFLQVLKQQAPRYLQSIITCHVSRDPPDLEGGLSLISQLRKEKNHEQLEKAVEHICFLADVNRLYDAALGIYDLDVALLVAQQSQKDPREYLPYLQRLNDMATLRQRFSIDNDLKKYKKALTHLYAIDDFDELKSYVAKHELYSAAIDLHRYDSNRLVQLMRIYAEFLSNRNRYKEAGIAYEYITDYAAAFEAYRGANMWRECLSCAALVGMPEDKISDLARDIAEGLVEAKDFLPAATIHLEYLNDLESAARLLCRGFRFADAMRYIAMRREDKLLKSVIDAGLVESSATMTEMLAEMKSQLNAQIPRLRELRQKKVDDPMAFLDGGEAGGDNDVADNISLAPTDASTSGGTFMTRYTNRSTGTLATNATRKTSKNRRREERKRARGKKGTVYEEEYLVNSVARMIERLNSIGEDVGRLVEGLMRRTMRERAVAVDAAYQDIVLACQGCMEEVFGGVTSAQQPDSSPTDGVAEQPQRIGGQGVLWDAIEASSQHRQMPVLKQIARLSLLEPA